MRNRLISKLMRSTVMRSNVQGYVAPLRVQSSLARQQIDGPFAESERKFSTLPTDRAQQSVKQLKIFAEVNGKRSAINIVDSEDVDALRKQIKNEFARQLNAYDAADLVVKTSAKSTEALNPEAILRDVLIDAQGKQLKYVYVELPLAPTKVPGKYILQKSVAGMVSWDGITLDDACRLPRADLVRELWNNSASHTLLKGPPACGKTSLLQSFVTECVQANKKTVVVTAKGKVDASSFILLSARDQGYVFSTVDGLLLHIDFLIIDDAQLFWEDKDLWTNLKLPAGSGRIIAAATYDLRTLYPNSPAIFGKKMTNFNLSADEQQMLVDRLMKVYGPDQHPWAHDKQLLKIICGECSGNVGALRITFSILASRFLKTKASPDTALNYFLSRWFFTQNEAHRVFNHLQEVNSHQRLVLQSVISSYGDYESPIADPDADALVRAGVLCKESDDDMKLIRYSFSTMMHRRYFFSDIFPHRADKIPPNADSLVRSAIAGMSFNALSRGLNFCAGTMPKEALFRAELYRSASSQLHPVVEIIPEVDRILDQGLIAPGLVRTSIADFWINGELCWLVECVVMLDDYKWEHKYEPRLNHWKALKPKEKLLVDFRSNSPPKSYRDIPGYRAVVLNFEAGTADYVVGEDKHPIGFHTVVKT